MNQLKKVLEMLGVKLYNTILIYQAESNEKILTSFRFTDDGIEHYWRDENGADVWEEEKNPTFLRLVTGMYEAVDYATMTNEEFRERLRKWNEYYDKYKYKTHKLEGDNNRLAEVLKFVGLEVGEIFMVYDVEAGKKKPSLFRFTRNNLEIFRFGLFGDELSKWESRHIYSNEDLLLKLITGKAIALHGNEIENEKVVIEYSLQPTYEAVLY